MQDRNHYVVEELTQLPPHLLPPPYLVNIDGHAHPLCYQEAILKHIRPVKRIKPEKTMEEIEDYDEYMKRHLATVKQQSFGFSRARSNTSASVQASSSQQENGLQAGPMITQGPSAQILSPQERTGGHSDHESTVESATQQSGSVDQPDPHRPSSDSLYLATEHNYAGVQAPADSYSSSESQSRGSQFLSAVQHQRMVVAVVLDGKKEDTREAQTVEGVCRPRSESKQSDVDEDKSGGACLQESAPAEVPMAMDEPVVANSSGSEQGGSSAGGEGDSSGCHSMGGTAINIPSSAAANTFRSPPPSPPPLPPLPPAGTDTNSNNRPADDDEEPVINVTDDDGTDVRNMLFSLVGSLGLGEAEQKQAISLWHNRVIVPSLDVATLSSEEARRRELYQKEERRWGEENSRITLTLVRTLCLNELLPCVHGLSHSPPSPSPPPSSSSFLPPSSLLLLSPGKRCVVVHCAVGAPFLIPWKRGGCHLRVILYPRVKEWRVRWRKCGRRRGTCVCVCVCVSE